MPSLPPATLVLVVLNVLLFFAGGALAPDFVGRFALWPLGAGFEPWQVVSYAFLHANGTHLLFNMLGIWTFGADLERLWGSARYLVLYFASVLTAAAAQLVVGAVAGSVYPTVGASGGLFGLLLAYGMLFPERRLLLLIPPIPMRAKFFVPLYGLVELVLGVTGTQEGVAHFAHLGGMLGGFLVLRAWRARRLPDA